VILDVILVKLSWRPTL